MIPDDPNSCIIPPPLIVSGSCGYSEIPLLLFYAIRMIILSGHDLII